MTPDDVNPANLTIEGACPWCPFQSPEQTTHKAFRECLLGHTEILKLCDRHTAEALAVVRFCADCDPDRTTVTWTVDGVVQPAAIG